MSNIAPASPASVAGPNTSTLFSSYLSAMNPLNTVREMGNIGRALADRIVAPPSAADYRKPNVVLNNPARPIDSTLVNAANFLGVNLNEANDAQFAAVKNKAAEFLTIGAVDGQLLRPVDRASAVSALTKDTPLQQTTKGTTTGLVTGTTNWLGDIINAVAPTLVQTGITSYLHKNDPALRQQRQIDQSYLALQQQQVQNEARMREQTMQLQREALVATTELEREKIRAQTDAQIAALMVNYGSVVPPIGTSNGVGTPINGTAGVPVGAGQDGALLGILGAMLMGARPVATNPYVPSPNAPITTPLAAMEAQNQQAQASGSPVGRNLLISALVIGGAGFLIYSVGRRKKRS